MMIFRLSQKLATKIKAPKLTDLPSGDNPFADWSSHLFTANRAQYIILMNTVSFYSCVMNGRGITRTQHFEDRARETLRDFTADDGHQLAFRLFIEPALDRAEYAKPLNRSVIGSMNELVTLAKFMIEDGMSAVEVGYRLNGTPMSALALEDGQNYAYPKEVFAKLLDRLRKG